MGTHALSKRAGNGREQLESRCNPHRVRYRDSCEHNGDDYARERQSDYCERSTARKMQRSIGSQARGWRSRDYDAGWPRGLAARRPEGIRIGTRRRQQDRDDGCFWKVSDTRREPVAVERAGGKTYHGLERATEMPRTSCGHLPETAQ